MKNLLISLLFSLPLLAKEIPAATSVAAAENFLATLDPEQKPKATGIEKVRFGWAGGTKPGEAYYYRIQGPTFLMEAANTQNNANHIHATWRSFDGDFGRDLLGEPFKCDH
jgi:hypothetical protein